MRAFIRFPRPRLPPTSRDVTFGSAHGQTRVTPGSDQGHSEGSKNSYMDQCTIGAVPLRGGTNAHGTAGAQMVRRRQEHQSAWKGAKRSSKAAERPITIRLGGRQPAHS